MKSKKKGFSLFWRGVRARWVLSYPVPGSKSWRQHVLPETFTKADRARANTYAVEWLAKAPAPPPPVDHTGATWSHLADKWLAIRRARATKGSTMLDYRSHLSTHILPTFGAEPAAALGSSVPRVRAWLRELRGKLSPSRVRGALSTFRQFVDDAIAEEWVRLAGNPLRSSAVNAELPALKQGPVIVVPLEHVQKILDAVDRVPLDWRVRCCLGFTTGLSDGELAGLRWRDVDLDASPPTLRVVQAVALQEDRRNRVSSPKRPSRMRTLPLHPAASAALAQWRREGAPVLLQRDAQADDLILCGPKGAPTRPSSADKLRRTLLGLGLPETTPGGQAITFQAARRTFLTVLEAAGVSLERRQRLAGHAKASVTEQHYTAGDLSALASDVARIGLVWPVTVSQLVTPGTGGGGADLGKLLSIAPDRSAPRRIRKPLLYPLSYGGDGDGRGKLAPGDTTANGLDAASGFGTGVVVVPGTTPRVSAEIAKLAEDLSVAGAFDEAIAKAGQGDVDGVARALARVARAQGHPETAAALERAPAPHARGRR